MTDINKTRQLHRLLDKVADSQVLDSYDIAHLRATLPELPKKMTLEEITEHVYDAWVGTEINEWPDDIHGDLEIWLDELHAQLQGVKTHAEPFPVHPEFLETEADYAAAPEGTVVAMQSRLAWVKERANDWTCRGGSNSDYSMALSGRRRVWRWGNK